MDYTIAKSIRVKAFLTLCLDGGGVDGQVRVAGEVSGPQEVLADPPGGPGELGRLQVEGLPRLHRKLGAPAMPQGQAMGALGFEEECGHPRQKHTQRNT